MKLKEVFERYLISECGKLFIKESGKEVIGTVTEKGYKITTITCSSGRKVISFHRLVAMAWVDNPNNLKEVDHLDGNKLNNHASNLEWVTRGENIKRAYSLNFRTAVGVANANAKLSEQQVKEICEGVLSGLSNVQIEELTSVKRNLVSRIRCKKSWKSISDNYF